MAAGLHRNVAAASTFANVWFAAMCYVGSRVVLGATSDTFCEEHVRFGTVTHLRRMTNLSGNPAVGRSVFSPCSYLFGRAMTAESTASQNGWRMHVCCQTPCHDFRPCTDESQSDCCATVRCALSLDLVWHAKAHSVSPLTAIFLLGYW